MQKNPQIEKTMEARVVELERYVLRLRIGLIAVASLIIWQATSAMGWLGPIRIYATEIYASHYILEDAEEKVHGRWEVPQDAPAQLTLFDEGPDYVRLNAEGLKHIGHSDYPDHP